MPETCENWLGLGKSYVYYACQTRESYPVLSYSVNLKAPGELWNPLSKTVLSKCGFFWNEGPEIIRNDRKDQKSIVCWACKYVSIFSNANVFPWYRTLSRNSIVFESSIENDLTLVRLMTAVAYSPVTSHSLQWHHMTVIEHHKSPATPLFVQPCIQVYIKENIQAPRHRPFVTAELPRCLSNFRAIGKI